MEFDSNKALSRSPGFAKRWQILSRPRTGEDEIGSSGARGDQGASSTLPACKLARRSRTELRKVFPPTSLPRNRPSREKRETRCTICARWTKENLPRAPHDLRDRHPFDCGLRIDRTPFEIQPVTPHQPLSHPVPEPTAGRILYQRRLVCTVNLCGRDTRAPGLFRPRPCPLRGLRCRIKTILSGDGSMRQRIECRPNGLMAYGRVGTAVVPEPSSFALMGLASLVLFGRRRRA